MDPWEMFSEMTKLVVENQNVILEVTVSNNLIHMQLVPIADEENENDY